MNNVDAAKTIADNWNRVVDEVNRATELSGRPLNSVQIIGVSKYVNDQLTQFLVDAGCNHLGESRPQVLWQKAETINTSGIRWHLIGHLQRNKVRRVLKSGCFLQTIDSRRLLDAVAEEGVQQEQTVDALLEVNISGDDAKTGLGVTELIEILSDLPTKGIHIRGLMAMAGWGTDAHQAQKQFARVRELRDQLVEQTSVPLPELSMGMSGDFPQAIAEGATIVRIGSRLFDGVR